MNTKNYFAPEVEIISVELENGIAQTGGFGGPGGAGGGVGDGGGIDF